MTVASDLDARILAAIGDALPMRRRDRPRITPDARLHADLGLNSLGVVALLFRLQEALAIELGDEPDVDIGALVTVDDLLRVARALLDHTPEGDR